MKKLLLSVLVGGILFADGTVVSVNQDYIDNLSKGWNLVGVEHEIDDLSILKNVDIAWLYNNTTKKWEIYSPMQDIQFQINSLPYNKITSIPAGSGIWVYRKIDLPKFEYFDYEIVDENENEAQVRLKINISLPQDSEYPLFFEAKAYDNNQEINLSFLPPIDENYSIADVNLSTGEHEITICQGVGLGDFSPSTIRYNVCKSMKIDINLPDFNDNDLNSNILYNFNGIVTDTDNNYLKDVTIVLQLADKNITAKTDENGAYDLKIDENITFPVLLTAYKDGYLPNSKNVYKEENSTIYKIDFQLQPQEDVIIIDKTLHHLGDDNYGGTINSQFQAKSEGVVYTKEFNLSDEFLSSHENAILTLYIKGVERDNPLYINDKRISYLNESPSDGSFELYSVEIPISDLKNQNVLKIESLQEGDDYDDFEFANIQLKGD